MIKKLILVILLAFAHGISAFADEADSVYLFAYGTNGLRFAWSQDQKNWNSIGDGFAFVKSDYGRWGSQKKMITPYLIQGRNGSWQCVWQLNSETLQFAHASSTNLVDWGPQSYPYLTKSKNVLHPVISYDKSKESYSITYVDAAKKYFQTSTRDFKSFDPVKEVTAAAYIDKSVDVSLNGQIRGQIIHVAWSVVDKLIKAYQLQQYKNIQNSETTRDDAQRFAGLKTVEAKLVLQPQKAKPISKMLMGIFFEDINYAADGGLYAEMIQNRGFEYNESDKSYRDKEWNQKYAWTLKGNNASFAIDSIAPVHGNNPHYAVLSIQAPGASLTNSGFDGIAVKKGENYYFSSFVRQMKGKGGTLAIRLVSEKAGVIANLLLKTPSTSWKSIKGSLVPNIDATDVRLEIQPKNEGIVAFDMVSLFPQKTFKNRTNGLRADLAQAIADIHPRFVRFPGGCLAHGDGIANIYKWKNSIGPLESRKPDRNLWGYHQTMGLGYFEYFQFCEDIGAAPVPVIAAGVPCQNSGTGGGGQQGGIPMSEMGQYIQDIIDLVEYANGSINTKWGKKRAEAGHPKPFNLKYIGIGNEDQITEVFKERFEMIYKALKKAHPEITIIGTAGPFFEGTDYVEGWKIASNLNVPIIDEHYYQSPGWFINNQDYYDRYDRTKSKVYLGEYAASLPGGNKTNLETSLAEALYLTALERNGDVVSMASYAPLLAREGHTQWNPDLIYFNNTTVKPTIGYHVQKLYGQNAGDHYIPALQILSDQQESVRKRIAYSVVKDKRTGDLIVKLVNFLPLAVKQVIDFGDLKTDKAHVAKTLLTGKPTDKMAIPVTSEINLGTDNALELPAYSFTVLRMKVDN